MRGTARALDADCDCAAPDDTPSSAFKNGGCDAFNQPAQDCAYHLFGREGAVGEDEAHAFIDALNSDEQASLTAVALDRARRIRGR